MQLGHAALMLRRAARPVSKHEGVSRDRWRPFETRSFERCDQRRRDSRQPSSDLSVAMIPGLPSAAGAEQSLAAAACSEF
jgi:hypothetical protein